MRQPLEGSLKTYILYVHDDRYSVPNMNSIVVHDDAQAIEIATEYLAASLHHWAVEVWDGERLVGRIDRPDLDSPAD